jgi:metal transporter CNNM
MSLFGSASRSVSLSRRFYRVLIRRFFSVSKLRLEVEVAGGNRDASVLLGLRKDSNLALATVLWGNVAINVLLTLLSDFVFAGVGAFRLLCGGHHAVWRDYSASLFFANAIRMAALLAPLPRVYQVSHHGNVHHRQHTLN